MQENRAAVDLLSDPRGDRSCYTALCIELEPFGADSKRSIKGELRQGGEQ